jgi:hypothetical protein
LNLPLKVPVPAILARLPERFRWTLHNIVAHPLSELLFQVGLRRWSDAVHDLTVPEHEQGTGRG